MACTLAIFIGTHLRLAVPWSGPLPTSNQSARPERAGWGQAHSSSFLLAHVQATPVRQSYQIVRSSGTPRGQMPRKRTTFQLSPHHTHTSNDKDRQVGAEGERAALRGPGRAARALCWEAALLFAMGRIHVFFFAFFREPLDPSPPARCLCRR
jgi:hypothetical protein